MFLEVLHRALVLFCFFKCVKGAEIAPFPRRFGLLSRIQTIVAGFEFADHNWSRCVTEACCCLEMIQAMVPQAHYAVSFRARADGQRTAMGGPASESSSRNHIVDQPVLSYPAAALSLCFLIQPPMGPNRKKSWVSGKGPERGLIG
jgi:hypothetical protein